jgi:cell division septation protein DedD
MNSLLDEDEDDLKRERELTLSTGMILGIFLALVLLCGAFFGFGYKMGSHETAPVITAAAAEGTQPESDTFNGFNKPSAGSPAGGGAAEPVAETSGSGDGSGEASGAAAEAASKSPAVVAPAHSATPVATAAPQPVATGSYVVQVAAVSHEEDAQLLVSALKAKGYPVTAHTEAADKFYHIQVGPFGNVKDAAAAKARLVADGYQPIIK